MEDMRTVLIVDDCPVFGAALRRTLKASIRTARTIGEGLFVAGDWQPTVVLLDVNFPDECGSGIDAIPAFQKASPRTQIVIMSAVRREEDIRLAAEKGAVAYIVKANADEIQLVVDAAARLAPNVVISSSRIH